MNALKAEKKSMRILKTSRIYNTVKNPYSLKGRKKVVKEYERIANQINFNRDLADILSRHKVSLSRGTISPSFKKEIWNFRKNQLKKIAGGVAFGASAGTIIDILAGIAASEQVGSKPWIMLVPIIAGAAGGATSAARGLKYSRAPIVAKKAKGIPENQIQNIIDSIKRENKTLKRLKELLTFDLIFTD